MKWTNDHCGCVLNVNFNNTLQTYDLVSIDSRCSNHAPLAFNSVIGTVVEENQRKNNTIQEFINQFGTLIADPDPASGTLVLKNGISIDYTFTGTAPNRVMNVTANGITLTQQQKNAIQTKLNQRFGNGKVVVN